MANKNKTYQDLSRRALIKLNSDFDSENNNALLNYLNEKLEADSSCYEPIRVSERVIVCGDKIGAGVKKSIENMIDNGSEAVSKVLSKFSDKAASTIIEKML